MCRPVQKRNRKDSKSGKGVNVETEESHAAEKGANATKMEARLAVVLLLIGTAS